MIIHAADGLDVELDDEHWRAYILRGHPELTPHLELVIETLKCPEGVYRSKRDLTTRIYARTYAGIMVRKLRSNGSVYGWLFVKNTPSLSQHTSPWRCGVALTRRYGLPNRATI